MCAALLDMPTTADSSPSLPVETANLMTCLLEAKEKATLLSNTQSAIWDRFVELGLPTRRQDPWRQMDLREITQMAYDASSLSSPMVSMPQSLPTGVDACFLKDLAPEEQSKTVEDMTSGWNIESDTFCLLNSALMQDALIIRVNEGVNAEQPIRVAMALPPGADKPTYLNARVLVLMHKDSQATVMLDCHTRGSGLNDVATSPILTNSVLQVQADANSQCHLVIHHNETVNTRFLGSEMVRAEAGAQVNITKLQTGEGIRRIRMSADLVEAGAHVALNSLTLLGHEAKVHQHWNINHLVPNATSQQLAKTILTDRALCEFNGTIAVAPGANGTDATQMCQSMLLSDKAKAIALPQLRIEADDVKCAHGATVGQLDEEPLFYLISRGFTREQAKQLLLLGFVDEVTDTIASPALRKTCQDLIRSELRSLVTERQAEVN